MSSGQTLRVCPEGKPVPAFPDHALINAVVMMPAVVVTPVVVAPMAIVTDAPRSVMGPDDRAAAVGVIIRVIIIIGVVRRSIEEMPVKAVVPERESAVANATTAEHMCA